MVCGFIGRRAGNIVIFLYLHAMKTRNLRHTLQMLKLVLQAFAVLFLFAATFFVGLTMSWTNIDLAREGRSTGIVSSAELTGNKNGRSNLTIRLKGDSNKYSLYRFSQEYQPIIDRLNNGDQVTIFHNKFGSASMNYEIYQINTAKGVVYSKTEHESRERMAGRYIAIPGGLAILIGGFWVIRKRYKKISANRQYQYYEIHASVSFPCHIINF